MKQYGPLVRCFKGTDKPIQLIKNFANHNQDQILFIIKGRPDLL